MTARWLPALYFVVFIGAGFGWRTWVQWRRFGSSGVVLFRSGRWVQHLREASLFAVVLLLAVEVIRAGVSPAAIARLAPLASLGSAGVALGCLLAGGGLALMLRAQLEMGASWRIGVDERSRPGLVTHGLYRWTRNPIYLSMFLALAGLLLLLPTWITLLALLGAIAGVRQQVREEEAHLLRTYGDEYRRYAARVARFVPGIPSPVDVECGA